MEVLPILLFLVYMHHVVSDDKGIKAKGAPKLGPKKSAKKDWQILVARRFLNKDPHPEYQTPEHMKRPAPKHGYTVFPKMGLQHVEKLATVPNSPYFPIENMDVQRPRIKHAISDYAIIGVRKKRDTLKEQHSLKNQVDTKKSAIRDPTKEAKLKQHLPAKPMKQGKEGAVKSKPTLKQTKQGAKLRSNGKKLNKTNQAKRNKKHTRTNSTKKSKRLRMDRRNSNASKVTPMRLKANDSRRLIAARDAMIEDYPYVVSIQKNDEHWCAGALLNPQMVVTTANCMWKSNRMSRLRVRVGSRHAERGGFEVGVKEVMKHPRWSIRSNPDNDVALLYLDRRIKFSHKLHGVDLPNRSMMPPFEDAWITSWGAERRDGVFDKKAMTLQVYHARLMDRNKCNNITQRFGVMVTDNFICLSQSGRQAPCTRDTGAPAVSDGVLWGLASWGIRRLCGTERFPAMFSYLASHSNMDFIINATRLLMSDKRIYPFLDRFPTVRNNEEETTLNPLYD